MGEEGSKNKIVTKEEGPAVAQKKEGDKKRRPRVLMAPGMNRCIACYSCMLACARMVYRSYSIHKSAIKILTRGGYTSKFVANICRACIDPPCARACCVKALVPREGGGIRYHRDRCIGCRKCAEACVVQVIDFDEEEKKAIICIQCGNCASFCPHECLTMEISPHAEMNKPGGAFPTKELESPSPERRNPNDLIHDGN
ncbi:4Fe-4S dicluster domain-containing protein [Heliorestis acidaminivorans]|uniref:4Fe-4S dicluster domain-containing protein n=1 Tax=Heliorestis acidaminivorans TaxID=553427 RepID=UPI001FA98FD5|nr:(Fe-S)-binding protein [Heliorestis acidaminivorans]